jgi:hypothetical protein
MTEKDPSNPAGLITYMEAEYDPSEQDLLMHCFMEMLWAATGDGGKKRAAGTKPPWWRDPGHGAAFDRHFQRWAEEGEKTDKDSGAHPLVHAAWRALAIAYQETYGKVDPETYKALVEEESYLNYEGTELD